MGTVLVADDEANLRKVLRTLLTRAGHEVVVVRDGLSALEIIKAGGVDILITDLKMPGLSGLELLQKIKEREWELPVILITAHGTIDTAVSALKNGAFDYITKPFDKDELCLAVTKALAVGKAVATSSGGSLIGSLGGGNALDFLDGLGGRFKIIGLSAKMQEVYEIIDKVLASPSTVLLTGESGTGKELVAKALHEHGPRQTKPFIKVNCAAIPKDLLESEFFGYEQGAFTGAVSSKPGRFELADGGTLFLDEIAEIPSSMQVKLLRALQESEFERVGGVKTIRVDVRLIAATNRDLVKEIARGNFREDLYYRLKVVPLELPPLRERKEDIPLLVKAFIAKYNKRLGKNLQGITPLALSALAAYQWPGNIRELENVIERSLLFSESSEIQLAALPSELRALADAGAETLFAESLESQVSLPNGSTLPGTSLKDIVKQATWELERDLITKALEETGGNVTKAANLLQISRKGLQNKMKEFGLRES